MYVNGAAQTVEQPTAAVTTTGNRVTLGSSASTTNRFAGDVGLVRVWGLPLSNENVTHLFARSATRFGVSASVRDPQEPDPALLLAAFDAALAVPLCRERGDWTDGEWSHLSVRVAGGTAALHVNGRRRCAVSVSDVTDVSDGLTLGEGGRGKPTWTGAVADLRLYSTSAHTDGKTNFDATAHRFRTVPMHVDPLPSRVLQLDAANARGGIHLPAPGCPAAGATWFDLSPQGLDASLDTFACAAGAGV